MLLNIHLRVATEICGLGPLWQTITIWQRISECYYVKHRKWEPEGVHRQLEGCNRNLPPKATVENSCSTNLKPKTGAKYVLNTKSLNLVSEGVYTKYLPLGNLLHIFKAQIYHVMECVFDINQ